MQDIIPIILISVLTAVAVASAAVAIAALLRRRPRPRVVMGLTTVVAVGLAGLKVYRILAGGEAWQPLDSHFDGLTLLAMLLAFAVLLLDRPRHLPGLGIVALPLLAVLLAWAVCAAVWTWYPFDIRMRAVWETVHVAGAYPALLLAALATGGGALFLLARRRLRSKQRVPDGQQFASLESIERWMVRWAAMTALVLAVLAVTGVVEALGGRSRMGGQWWTAPKVALAAAALVGYLLVALAPGFGRLRGGPAAWISIAALPILMAALSLATLVPERDREGAELNPKLHEMFTRPGGADCTPATDLAGVREAAWGKGGVTLGHRSVSAAPGSVLDQTGSAAEALLRNAPHRGPIPKGEGGGKGEGLDAIVVEAWRVAGKAVADGAGDVTAEVARCM